MGQVFDADRLELNGQPFAVVERVGRPSNGSAAFSSSSIEILAHSVANSEAGRLPWFDRGGNAQGFVGPEGEYTDVRLSPDEKSLAASLVDPKTGTTDIWMNDLARGSNTRITRGVLLSASAI